MPRKKIITDTTKTTEEKLVAARKLVAKYEQQIATAAITNNIEVNDQITFRFGRTDKVRELAGVVTGIKDGPTGRMVAVITGEGFDVQTVKIRVGDIISNAAADARTGNAGDPLAAA